MTPIPVYKSFAELPRTAYPANCYTVDEVSEITGLSPGTIRRYCYDGKIGHVVKKWRYGWLKRQAIFIPKKWLVAFMAARLGSKYEFKMVAPKVIG